MAALNSETFQFAHTLHEDLLTQEQGASCDQEFADEPHQETDVKKMCHVKKNKNFCKTYL